MNIKLSIIVPVYNTSKYLSRCIDHLLEQGFALDEYEIILINDGSTDVSLAICLEYEKQYPNIKVLNQANQGVSIARNQGIELANGKMICFVDSDDYVVKGSYAKIFEECYQPDADIIRFFVEIKEEEDPVKTDNSGSLRYICSGLDFMERSGLETFCYCSFYRRDFLLKENIRFERLHVGEDFLFASTALLKAKKFVQTGYTPYVYVRHHGSSSTIREKNYSRVCVSHCILANNGIIRLMNETMMTERQRLIAEDSLRSKSVFAFSRVLTSAYSQSEYKEIISRLNQSKLLPHIRKSWPISFVHLLILVISHSYFSYKISSLVYSKSIIKKLY